MIRTQPNSTPPESDARILRIRDLSGGQKSAQIPTLLKDKEAQLAKNVSFSLRGAVKLRDVYQNRYSSSFASKGVIGLGSLFKSDGTSRLLVAVEDKLYYDKPHFTKRYDDQATWEEGTVTYISTTDTPGKLVLGDTSSAPTTITKLYNDMTTFSLGTFENTAVVNDALEITDPPPLEKIYTEDSDFTGSGVNVDIANGGIQLHGVTTWEGYESNTWDELILM